MQSATPSVPASPAVSPEDALRRFFQNTAFRPGQREAIDALLAGEDVLAIMPTGGGKSLIYEIAALLLPGTAIVVSPLIALIKDQMASLAALDYPGVGALHSQIAPAEQRATLEALRAGQLRLLYVTPERCASEEFLAVARAARISLLAVDEAHAISEWGHDFRPEYQLLDDAARALGRPPLVALTATATPWVREDITARLGLRSPRVIVRGFDRPNLFYEVYRVADEREKAATLAGVIAAGEATYPESLAGQLSAASAGSGIVYTGLTRTARGLSQALNRAGVHSAYYHGQLKAGQRTAVQERFTAGGVRAIAATYAFGMGIDLPDLRWVAHYDAPFSLESYYQESGRAGRDGAFSRCPLLFLEDDLGRAAFSGGSGSLGREDLERVAQTLVQGPASGRRRAAIAAATALALPRVVRALEVLLAAGAATERHGVYRATPEVVERIDRALATEARRAEHHRTRVEMVRRYVLTEGCRRQFLLQYFGQYDAPDSCAMCDRCVPRLGESLRASLRREPDIACPFQAGDVVEHGAWGRGVIQNVAGNRLTVHFPEAGYRTLDLAAVVEGGLLQRWQGAA